jgi:curli biogenesis system outer membrane secretion channel CsgG
MKKDMIVIVSVFLAWVLGACGTMRVTEASIRRNITSAVDKASAEIINSLPNGIKLAALSGTSSGDDREIVVAYLKSQGLSDSQARVRVQLMDRQDISQLAAVLIEAQESSRQGNSYADYAVEDLEYNMVKAGGFSLVDRQRIEQIRNEQQFQTSGEVDDNSAVSIGKMAGANAVIIISVTYSDGSGRLTLTGC